MHKQASGQKYIGRLLILSCLAASIAAVPHARAGDAPVPDLTPAQTALFSDAHLSGITHEETLIYRYETEGPAHYTDRVDLNIVELHADGSRDVTFHYLSGPHHVFYPALDNYRSNPIAMLFLDNDSKLMREQLGIAAAYVRDRIRQGFLTEGGVSPGTFTLDGKTLPASVVTIHPFRGDPHFGRVPVIANKTYTFVLCDAVPGKIAMIKAEEPADAALGAPAIGAQLTYTGTTSLQLDPPADTTSAPVEAMPQAGAQSQAGATQ